MALQLIYLDQCAASEMARRSPPWDRIRALIESKVAEGKILCPLSYETELESTACDEPTRIALADLFDNISGGYKIRCFDELVGEETIRLVRKHPFRLLVKYANLIPVEAGHTRMMKYAFETAKATMEARARAFQYLPEQLGRSVTEVKNAVDFNRAGILYRDVKRLLSDQTTAWKPTTLLRT